MTQSSLTISESVKTWIALMIFGSAATHFSSTISESTISYVHWWFDALVVELNRVDDFQVGSDAVFINNFWVNSR